VEVGGQRGREALDRLRNVVGRVESSWRPASAEEGFEIVRRRLFEPLTDPAHFRDRDVVARAFADFYRTQHQEFPPECRDADYEKRLRAAYPIHPEVFDRLYTDWSTLVKFQRTRGVLRLMAAVIHSLWEKGDRNPLIQPANIPIDDPRVQFELRATSRTTGYQSSKRTWTAPMHCLYGSTAMCRTSAGSQPADVWREPFTWDRLPRRPPPTVAWKTGR
jgi:predicted AAA+ superfamily ATPase